jgi:hypothetical protein
MITTKSIISCLMLSSLLACSVAAMTSEKKQQQVPSKPAPGITMPHFDVVSFKYQGNDKQPKKIDCQELLKQKLNKTQLKVSIDKFNAQIKCISATYSLPSKKESFYRWASPLCTLAGAACIFLFSKNLIHDFIFEKAWTHHMGSQGLEYCPKTPFSYGAIFLSLATIGLSAASIIFHKKNRSLWFARKKTICSKIHDRVQELNKVLKEATFNSDEIKSIDSNKTYTSAYGTIYYMKKIFSVTDIKKSENLQAISQLSTIPIVKKLLIVQLLTLDLPISREDYDAIFATRNDKSSLVMVFKPHDIDTKHHHDTNLKHYIDEIVTKNYKPSIYNWRIKNQKNKLVPSDQAYFQLEGDQYEE